MLFQPLPWGCWVGSTGGTHGAEMEPSARSYPLLKPMGPPHASPRKTSNKTTLRTPLFPYLTQVHVDISYSRQLAWRPTIKLDWHSDCGVGNSEFGVTPETLKWFNQEERVRFSTRWLVWIKPRTWVLGARVFSHQPCTGTGIMYWELWISQLTRTGKHCMLVRNKGRVISVCICACVWRSRVCHTGLDCLSCVFLLVYCVV